MIWLKVARINLVLLIEKDIGLPDFKLDIARDSAGRDVEGVIGSFGESDLTLNVLLFSG